jgi:hypothetical protein
MIHTYLGKQVDGWGKAVILCGTSKPLAPHVVSIDTLALSRHSALLPNRCSPVLAFINVKLLSEKA